MRGARWFTAAALAALIGCGQSSPTTLPPTGQLLLHIDTDAPVAEAAGTPTDPSRPVPLFDRLRIDGLPSDGISCADCTREADVTAARFAAGSISFGVLPDKAGSGVVRVRLFRGTVTVNGEPPLDSSIDVTASLPPIPNEGIVEATILLTTDDVGNPVGVDQPVTPVIGPPGPSLVGTWPGAARVDCAAPPARGQVCVPGGAYWMGDPAFRHDSDPQLVQRLVVLSPFYLDATEVTVAEYRASGMVPAGFFSGQRTGATLGDYCNFTTAPGPYEEYAVNCVSYRQAAAYCKSVGADLPTEAQLEYATSALGTGPYPWGQDEPQCDDAVYARGDNDVFAGFPEFCVSPDRPSGPAPVAHGARDLVLLPTGNLYDLSGDVYEFALDTWNRQADACWSRLGVYHDPLCTSPSKFDPSYTAMARAGSWSQNGQRIRAANRGPVGGSDQGSPDIGFRCAKRGG